MATANSINDTNNNSLKLDVRGNTVTDGVADVTAVITTDGCNVIVNSSLVHVAPSMHDAHTLARALWKSLDAWA